MTTELGAATWPEMYQAAPRPLLVVPVGSCEQHGPHLPLDTDSRIALALAHGLCGAFEPGQAMLAPLLGISASGEHASFPGTLSLGAAVFEQVLIELVRSADWSSGVVFVNGHAGNVVASRRAVRLLESERRRVLSWFPHLDGSDAHAGDTETSMMLAIAPELVDMSKAEAGRTEPISALIDDLRAGGVRAVSPNGVLGDPRRASAQRGRQLLSRLTIDLISAVDQWWV
jgi:mycofactocin precursor peptide peptidase